MVRTYFKQNKSIFWEGLTERKIEESKYDIKVASQASAMGHQMNAEKIEGEQNREMDVREK